MKNDRYLRSIPVVILSTSQTEEDIGNTYSLGANSFIAKPDSFEALVEIMRAACNYWIQIVRLPSEN